MAVYPMALPPYLLGGHSPSVQSSLFPSPLITPHMTPNYTPHSFQSTHIPQPSMSPISSSSIHASHVPHPILFQPLSVSQATSFPPQPIYVSPYITTQPLMAHLHPSSHHPGYRLHQHHQSCVPVSYLHPSCQPHIDTTHFKSVDEEYLDQMNSLLFSYIDAEDSPHKMEQREKLEHVVMEYLAITPHTHKFLFKETSEIIEKSISSLPKFSARKAAYAFDALVHFAANLFSEPWRKEFKDIKLYSGVWVHQIAGSLVGAETLLTLMGYHARDCSSNLLHNLSEDLLLSASASQAVIYVLEGVLDPDLISRLALDCLIAYCECQVLQKIYDGTKEFNLTWSQILDFRQHKIGGVDVTVRDLLFTLHQRFSQSVTTHQEPNFRQVFTTAPPIPIRLSSTSYINSNSALPGLVRSQSFDKPSDLESPKLSPTHIISCPKSLEGRDAYQIMPTFTTDYTKGDEELIMNSSCNNHYGIDETDSGLQKRNAHLTSNNQVPTAKLIDLDLSLHSTTKPSHYSKVSSRKSVSKLNSSRKIHKMESIDKSYSVPPPPDIFKSGTVDEHLQASLSLVRDMSKKTKNENEADNHSGEWDFVFKRLQKTNYSKDIGDRGDILQSLLKATTNADNKQYREDNLRTRPLTFPDALQKLSLSENVEKERSEKDKYVTKCVMSSGTAVQNNISPEVRKYASPGDNMSAFETALQSSDDYEFNDGGNKCNNKGSSSSSVNCCTSNSRGAVVNPHSHQEFPSDSSNLTTCTILKQNDSELASKSNSENSWSCAFCTFSNEHFQNACEMCGKSRNPVTEIKPLVSGGRQCPKCTLINDKDAVNCSVCETSLEGSSTYI